MSDNVRNPAQAGKATPSRASEADILLESLRAHGQVVESDDPNAPLAPGQTHVYVRHPGQQTGTLIEKRKSLFRR